MNKTDPKNGILDLFSEREVDDLERCFIDREWTVKKIANSRGLTQKVVRELLMTIGLEVEGKVKEGMVTSGKAICLEKSYEITL